MTGFWLIGASMAVAALLLVLRPLLAARAKEGVTRSDANLAIYRDQMRELDADLAAGSLAQADYERSRHDLEARLLRDVSADREPARRSGTAAAIALGIALPACALSVYLLVGNPGGIESGAAQPEAMIERLSAQLRENPDDATGWKMLGRSYAALGRFEEAVNALASAALRDPNDAQLLVDFADALATARGQGLAGEPEKLILRALELSPTNLKALALAGTAAFDRRDFAAAAGFWQRMLPLVPPESEDARIIKANVEEIHKLLAGGGGNNRRLTGKVDIAKNLKNQVKPDDTVFVFARAENGPPLPLAVMKVRASDLPLQFSLDDSMAMAPGMTLSAFPRVVVTARVSRSGAAAAGPGDMQGSSAAIASDAQGVTILIDSVVR